MLGFVWSLLAMGYGFMMALVIGGIVGANAFEPGGTPATFTAFLGAVVGILGAVMAAALTLWGARAGAQGRPQRLSARRAERATRDPTARPYVRDSCKMRRAIRPLTS